MPRALFIKRQQAAFKAVNTYRYRQIEHCSYPSLIALHEEIQQAESDFENSTDLYSHIARNIGPTTYQSFTRFGDRNRSTPALILKWIERKGSPLDVQAMFMSQDYRTEIDPCELAAFMSEYDSGCKSFEPIARIIELKNIFKEMVGFNYDYNWIRRHLVNPDPELAELEPMPF